jgi:hypothetical protein
VKRRTFVGAALALVAARASNAQDTPKAPDIGSLPVQGFIDFQSQATLAMQTATRVEKEAEALIRSRIASIQIDVGASDAALETLEKSQLEQLLNAQHTVAIFLLKIIVYSKDKATGAINITRDSVDSAFNDCKLWPICPARG